MATSTAYCVLYINWSQTSKTHQKQYLNFNASQSKASSVLPLIALSTLFVLTFSTRQTFHTNVNFILLKGKCQARIQNYLNWTELNYNHWGHRPIAIKSHRIGNKDVTSKSTSSDNPFLQTSTAVILMITDTKVSVKSMGKCIQQGFGYVEGWTKWCLSFVALFWRRRKCTWTEI